MSEVSVVAVREEEALSIQESDLSPLFERCLKSVREDLRDNPYILEGLNVLKVRGYRSAIGNFWNAVVDDLRNKITARSLSLFNKSVNIGREIKTYEDFQNYVNDDQLIEGALKIGVIGWEASKMLKHAKETRHIFDGHPRSSQPSPLKVLAMMEDCVKYVLNAEYPLPIIDIDDYLGMLGHQNFDRNPVGVENACGELPDIYKTELINRLFTVYVDERSSTVLRSNIEFVMPYLWGVLPKDVKIQVIRRVDQVIQTGNAPAIDQAFALARLVGATGYLSLSARRYKIQPLVERLAANSDNWTIENETVKELLPLAGIVPTDVLPNYVEALVNTYVGTMGSSMRFSRTDFYADTAALYIPQMFQTFDDRAAEAFVETVKTSKALRNRIRFAPKLRRLRSLGRIVLERVSEQFPDRKFLAALSDEGQEEIFLRSLGKVEGE